MKLNSEKRIALCSKALYAEQLKCYSDICECYAELSKYAGRNADASKIEAKYGKYLTLAAKGDLEFTRRENNFIFSDSYKGRRFSDAEIDLFKKFAARSKRLGNLKEGAAILDQAVDKKDHSIDLDKVDEYREYMFSASKYTRKLDQEISSHTPAYIGHQYYKLSRDSIKAIQQIDPSHLSGIVETGKLTPSQFGANISGRTSIRDVILEARKIDTPEERMEYAKEPSLAKEIGYRFVEKHHKALTRLAIGVVAAGLVAGGVSEFRTANEYNNLNINTMEQQGYVNNLSEETTAQITALRELYESTVSQGTLPTEAQLRAIGTSIDDIFDVIVAEKLEPSFLEAHPDATNISVSHGYNYTNTEDPKNTISITYTDADGKEKTENITDFSSASLFSQGDISMMFSKEYDTDKSYEEIAKIYASEDDYVSQSKKINEFLADYGKSIDFIEHFAAVDLHYTKNGSLFGIFGSSVKSDFPEKSASEAAQYDKAEQSTVDDTHDYSGNTEIDDDGR